MDILYFVCASNGAAALTHCPTGTTYFYVNPLTLGSFDIENFHDFSAIEWAFVLILVTKSTQISFIFVYIHRLSFDFFLLPTKSLMASNSCHATQGKLSMCHIHRHTLSNIFFPLLFLHCCTRVKIKSIKIHSQPSLLSWVHVTEYVCTD